MGDWKTIITIGREYGAGGRTVAKLLSDRLGDHHPGRREERPAGADHPGAGAGEREDAPELVPAAGTHVRL